MKISRYVLIFTLLINLFFPLSGYPQDINMDETYENSFRPDLPRSMQPIPDEDDDYSNTVYSPYVLIRIPRTVKSGKDLLTPGYYLVKPFSENNVDYLLFKNKNLAVALVPVLKKTDLQEAKKKKKKKKKNDPQAQLEVIEENHGKTLILNVQYDSKNYYTKLNVID